MWSFCCFLHSSLKRLSPKNQISNYLYLVALGLHFFMSTTGWRTDPIKMGQTSFNSQVPILCLSNRGWGSAAMYHSPSAVVFPQGIAKKKLINIYTYISTQSGESKDSVKCLKKTGRVFFHERIFLHIWFANSFVERI